LRLIARENERLNRRVFCISEMSRLQIPVDLVLFLIGAACNLARWSKRRLRARLSLFFVFVFAMRIPIRLILIFVLLVICAIVHAESWCDRDNFAIDTYLETLPRPELIRLARVGLRGSCTQAEPKSGLARPARHLSPVHRARATPKSHIVLNSTRDDTHVIQQKPHQIQPDGRRSRQLLQQVSDVDNATFNLLQQAFGPICNTQSGCTCFNGSADVTRPVCGSSWATCDAAGQLTQLYDLFKAFVVAHPHLQYF
jgi:hypothetical protein